MPQEFDWSFPYPSQRMPVLARNIVATSQPLAAQAGLDVLRDGGTAADAAVATAMAMVVLEPTTNGLGSDNFALVWDPASRRLNGLNASGRAPQALGPSHFSGKKEMSHTGWDPVTVPGAVSGWIALWRKFGRLPLTRLAKPAIDYAASGFPVAPLTASLWARAVKRLAEFPECSRTFLIDGRAPTPGELFRMPDHARTLQLIADSEGEAFYKGELAAKIAGAAKSDGGLMTADDLAAHQADWVEPISLEYRGVRLHEIPPNGQGIAALMALGILRHRDVSGLQVDCPDVIHLQIEAMKLAFADAHRYVADPRTMTVSTAELLDDGYLAKRAALIDPAKAQDFDHGIPKPGGTILLCAADESGMMVSLIQSQYEGFGSGVVIPGTGIAMNNRGLCFTLEEGHPNQVGGGKRPYHTIIPGFVTLPSPLPAGEGPGVRASPPLPRGEGLGVKEAPDAGVLPQKPLMAFGVMGGFMQPQGHVQVVTRLVDFHQNPQAALDAPRWQVMTSLKVIIEPGFEPALYEELRRRGHEIEIAKERSVTFGRGQAIHRLSDCYLGASDLRADGQAVGY